MQHYRHSASSSAWVGAGDFPVTAGKLRQRERRAAALARRVAQRFRHLQASIFWHLHELDRLAGRLHRIGTVAALALGVRRLECAEVTTIGARSPSMGHCELISAAMANLVRVEIRDR